MKHLIAKLEAATGPSRELDAEIACAVRFPALRPARAEDHKEHQRGYPPSIGDIWCPTGFLMADSYTSSLDAAMTLVPGRYGIENLSWWPFVAKGYEDQRKCRITILAVDYEGFGTRDRYNSVDATPALALCAASLRAQAEMEG